MSLERRGVVDVIEREEERACLRGSRNGSRVSQR